MLDCIKEKIKEYRIGRQLLKDFMQEHGDYLPKYAPSGQRLDWKIWAYQEGPHDIFTGKQNGKFRVAIEQRSPRALSDGNVYGYSTENKKLVIHEGIRWL